jgi:hypothetical protein
MCAVVLSDNPRSALTIVGVVADRVVPVAVIPRLLYIMIFTHRAVVYVIRKIPNGKSAEVFVQ